MKRTLLAGAAIAALALAAPAAHADTVQLWAGSGAGLFALTAFGAGSASINDDVGSLFTVQATATGSPGLEQPSFDTSTIDIHGTGQGTLYVWAQESGITGPLGVYGLKTNFASVSVVGAATTVTMTSYISAANHVFSPSTNLFNGTVMGTANFNFTTGNPGDASTTTATPNLTGTYTEAEEYAITFGSACTILHPCSVDLNISTSAVATVEPATLAVLGVGIAGLGYVRNRRSSAMAAAA